MDISTPTVSPLRQRMLDDMRMRKMAEYTQDGYIRAVRKLAASLGRSPDKATIQTSDRQKDRHVKDRYVRTAAICRQRLDGATSSKAVDRGPSASPESRPHDA